MESSDITASISSEIQAKSPVQCDQKSASTLRSSPKNVFKRKSSELSLNCEKVKRPKVTESNDCNEGDLNSELSDDSVKSRTKKIKRSVKSRRNDVPLDPHEIKSVLEGMEEEIEDVLEETAQKNKLTATNVKNILRHVITNEYVLAMVRNTMKAEGNECDGLEEAVFEPKLTRSKVKELREKQHMLPWPMSTPVKQQEPVTKSLLEEDFSDESSSDEDYKPNEDECPSDEDNVTLSPRSTDLDSSFRRKPLSPVAKIADDVDDESGLVIALPEFEPAVISTEADKIALRTRSKLPLNDTPLEAIEASFVAPDITVDMYDTHCDDEEWQTFLKELSKPIESIVEVEKPDDAEDDPEYNVLDDDDIPDELDLRYDNAVKVTRRELNALMAEIMEYAQLDFNDGEEEDDEVEVSSRINTSCVTEVDNGFVENVRTQWMTCEERCQLDQQMRMYVQLLAQSYLLSYGVPELNYINISSKLFLDEIKMFASREITVNERSAFHAHNLDGSLDIINEYENGRTNVIVRNHIKAKKGLPGISSSCIKKTLFNSNVFIYPELLPSCSFHKSIESKKATFTAAEDNLIALGLEQFSFSNTPIYYIQTLLMPPKTEHQIKLRIKNSKSPKAPLENPIKYYFNNKQAPPFPREVKTFDPNDVKAPKDYAPERLPKWMRVMLEIAMLSNSKSVPILPKKHTSSIITSTPITKPVPRPKYKMLLPRNLHFSPLKQISPILKKYNQKRLIMPASSLNSSTSRVRKTVQFAKRLVAKPSITTYVPVNNSLNIINDNITETSHLSNPIILLNTEIEPETILPDDGGQCLTKRTSDTEQLLNSKEITTPNTAHLNTNEIDVHNECEGLDEIDEEVADDEQDSAAHHDPTLVSNTSIKKQQSASKKKVKQQRDLESSLALLQPNLLGSDPKKGDRETLFANSYLLRVTEVLKEDPDTCETFLKALCRYQYSSKTPIKLYFELKEILKDYPMLADDFVAFLRPEQALDCGKFTEYVTLSKIRTLIRKIEVHFRNQPQHLLKILKTIAQFRQQAGITSADVLSTLQPLLKNQSILLEELATLLPDLPPSDHFMTDFEEAPVPNSDDDNSSIDSCEEVVIPDAPDPYGGKDCPCECHTSSTEAKVVNKSKHCIKCGIKFIDGRIYIQTGKVLKPAQVIYNEVPPEPTKIQSNELKPSKNKQSNCSSNVKCNTVADPLLKTETSQVKKDAVKSSIVNQQPPAPSDEHVPTSSKLPCDVIEDTVFPTVSSCPNKKSVPSDFRHLKDVIAKNKDTSTGEPTKTSNENAAVSKEQTNSEKMKWTRDEDKLIIYNCQRFGITVKSFETSASVLKTRTKEEIQERFIHVMTVLQQELKIK